VGWNVGGSIEETLNANDILPRLRRVDFIFIAETHSKRSWKLDIIDDYNMKRKDRSYGKAGGVAWFWAKKFDVYLKEYEVDIPGVLVLDVDFRQQGGWRLFLVGVYFPPYGPSSSSKMARFERDEISHNLPMLLTQLANLGVVLVVGDTNARVGDECDGKILAEDEEEQHDEEAVTQSGLFVKTRNTNEDKLVNNNGQEILMWARGCGLWILNGRCLPNTFTYFAKQGNSNCDTWLGSEEILQSAFGGHVSGPLLHSDHAILSLQLHIPLQAEHRDGFLDLVQNANKSKKHVWKMRRRPIEQALDDEGLQEQLRAEYARSIDIQEAANRMHRILHSDCFACPSEVERSVGDYLLSVETLSVVQWQTNPKSLGDLGSRTRNCFPKSQAQKMAETRFIQLKRKWRRLRFDQGQELDARRNMLEAKRLVVKYRRKEQRKHQRGSWHLISLLREGGKGEAMWRKLKQKKNTMRAKGRWK